MITFDGIAAISLIAFVLYTTAPACRAFLYQLCLGLAFVGSCVFWICRWIHPLFPLALTIIAMALVIK